MTQYWPDEYDTEAAMAGVLPGGPARIDALRKGERFIAFGDGRLYEYDHEHRGAHIVADVKSGMSDCFAGCAHALPASFALTLCAACGSKALHVRDDHYSTIVCSRECNNSTDPHPCFGSAAGEWNARHGGVW